MTCALRLLAPEFCLLLCTDRTLLFMQLVHSLALLELVCWNWCAERQYVYCQFMYLHP